MTRWQTLLISLTTILTLQGCSDGSDDLDGIRAFTVQLYAGAASRSILPTVAGGRAYLADAPGWPARGALDPDNPGVFVETWDQGRVDVGARACSRTIPGGQARAHAERQRGQAGPFGQQQKGCLARRVVR